jgi:hypothetical protein
MPALFVDRADWYREPRFVDRPTVTPTAPGNPLVLPYSVLPHVGQKPVVKVLPESVGRAYSRASPPIAT